MIPLVVATPPFSPSASLCFKPFFLNKPLLDTRILHCKKLQRRKRRNEICRAETSTDLLIGVAIGASILYSLVSPATLPPEDEEGDSVIDSTDSRFVVMGIISFIPYFNWLSWLFAWLDTGKQRYAVYAIVYLAPYLRTNLSISPEESWLPIASIILCIIHIQLEASIKNGDIQGLLFFNEVQNLFTSSARKDNEILEEEEETFENHLDLPSAREQARNETQRWRVPRSPKKDEKAEEERKN